MTKRWRLATIATAAIVAATVTLSTVYATVGGDGEAVAQTSHGPIEGTVSDGVRQFQGIPYAQAPVDDLRWTPPQQTGSWNEVRDATEPGPICPQTAQDSQLVPESDEDCLYLNVTAPQGDSEPKPVMVWMHGGGLYEGSGSEYDPSQLARDGDAIVVTFNYRLGAFGFYGHPELEGSGNFGLQDQQAALEWVQENAAAFGGDADNVTLFGESAGGFTTCAQMTSPGAKGLFNKAIMQSGSCATQAWMLSPGVTEPSPEAVTFWPDIEEVAASGAQVASALDCPEGEDQLSCMRGKSVEEVMEYNSWFYGAASGTATLPQAPDEALTNGDSYDVPVMTGNTRDEATMTTAWAEYPDQQIDEKRFNEITDHAFGENVEAVRQNYPRDDRAASNTWAEIDTDRSFACPQLSDAELFGDDVYRYEFADTTAPPLAPFPPESQVEPGSSHGSELAYLFDMDGKPVDGEGNPIALNADQQALSDTMIDYWTNFAHSGDPNGADAPKWPSDEVLGLDIGADGIAPVDAPSDHQCGFWDGYDRP